MYVESNIEQNRFFFGILFSHATPNMTQTARAESKKFSLIFGFDNFLAKTLKRLMG